MQLLSVLLAWRRCYDTVAMAAVAPRCDDEWKSSQSNGRDVTTPARTMTSSVTSAGARSNELRRMSSAVVDNCVAHHASIGDYLTPPSIILQQAPEHSQHNYLKRYSNGGRDLQEGVWPRGIMSGEILSVYRGSNKCKSNCNTAIHNIYTLQLCGAVQCNSAVGVLHAAAGTNSVPLPVCLSQTESLTLTLNSSVVSFCRIMCLCQKSL